MIVNELLDRPHAETLWSYNQLKHALTPADFIFVMCSYNLDIADYAHILFLQKKGKKIVLSGGIAHNNDLLATHWDEPEAIVFKNRLLELNMNEKDILIEDKATKQWPEIEWQVTSPKMEYLKYAENYKEDRLINLIVGDTWRIIDYAEKGYQTVQDMPENVKNSLDSLIKRGYTKHIKQ